MKSYMAKKGEIAPSWHLVDISGVVLGKAATQIATILMGKHRPEYTPHVDTGDFVVVINASKVKIVGRAKMTDRLYERYSGYPGGRRVETLRKKFESRPEQVVEQAVLRMLPKTKLGKVMGKKLKIYAGSDHPHQAQQPKELKL